MQANALIHILEGLMATGADAGGFFSRATADDANPRQRVGLWLECMKTILRSKDLREATDWEIAAVSNVIQTDTSLDASGGTVYGILVDSIFDVSGESLIVLIADTTGQTLSGVALGDGGAANFGDGTEAICFKMPEASGTTQPAYETWINPQGLVFATQIEVSADGDEGTNPTANDVRVWIVYRQDTEVRAE